jgi:hypothetical protein
VSDQDTTPQFSKAEFEPALVDSHNYFVRGLLFGIGGALVGLALYAAVVIITEYEIGFVSLAVGWIVGKAILKGSSGRTGRRYQITAAVLTYLAVSLSTIPIVIYQISKLGTSIESSAGAELDIPAMAGRLVFLSLRAPFENLRDMPSGLISLIILAVGVQIAWRMTGSTRQELKIAHASKDEKPTTLDLNR